MKRFTAALGLLLGVIVIPFCRGDEVHGILTNTLSFESFPYELYQVESAGGKLSLSMSGIEDPCLILRSPSGRFQAWERPYALGDFSTNLTVVLTNASKGIWTAIATVKRARYYDRPEPFVLKVQGAANFLPSRPDRFDTNIVEQAFGARGIESEARKLRRRILAASEQLSLGSVRSNLLALCQSHYTNGEFAIAQKKVEYGALEKKEQAILQALSRVDALGTSTNLVRGLLQTEMQSTTNELQRLSESLAELVATRNSYLSAERELSELDSQRAELERLEQVLLSLETPTDSDRRALGEKLKQLRAAWTQKAERLAEKLIKSRLISQFGGLSAGYDSQYLTSSWMNSRVVASYLGSIRGSAQSYMQSSQRYPLLASVNASRSAIYSDRDYPETQVDTSIWLPSLFPWPPPEASVKDLLDNRLLTGWPGGIKTLGDLDDTLTAALSAAGYPGASYFGVADGFALVTQLEQTASDGMPLSGAARWSIAIREMKSFSLAQYITALFTAPPGFFRVIAFIATSKPFATSGDRASFETIERWTQVGLNALPQEVRELPYTRNHRVTVLVYEFEKARNDDKSITSSPGRHTVREHLEKSKLLGSLQTLVAANPHR